MARHCLPAPARAAFTPTPDPTKDGCMNKKRMHAPGRRRFLSAAGATATALLLPRPIRAADSRIEVLAGEPIGTIHPDVYGHFVEHLGGVVYDGIWVGEGSKVPN